jgi:hypothetical protein
MPAATPTYPNEAIDAQPTAVHQHNEAEHNSAGSRIEWARVGFVALVLLVVWSGVLPRIAGIDWLALAGHP